MIPLVSGNLSVEYLMKSLAGGPVPPPGSNRAEIEQLAALRFGALEDYIGWAVVEPREGEFDWSYHRANLERCRQLGLKYVVYPWVHVVPAWWLAKGRFVGFRCLGSLNEALFLRELALRASLRLWLLFRHWCHQLCDR